MDTEGFEPKVFEGFSKGLHGGQTEFLLFECDWAWERNGFGYSNIQVTLQRLTGILLSRLWHRL